MNEAADVRSPSLPLFCVRNRAINIKRRSAPPKKSFPARPGPFIAALKPAETMRMMISAYRRDAIVVILLIAASSLFPTAWSFSLKITTATTRTTTTTTVLHGRKTRRGVLGNNVDIDGDGNVKLISNKMKQNKLGSVKNKKSTSSSNNAEEVGISPLLAEWGATAESSSSQRRTNDDDNENVEIDIIHQGDNSRHVQIMQQLLQSIDTTITTTTNFNVPKLVSDIVSLTKLGSTTSTSSNDRVLLPKLKSLLSKDTTSYRLAWVGSDDAICHIGTSLHKVPLARLQEVYLSLGGGGSVVGTTKYKWELLEVIRILGPFPNVRNTLRGNVVGLTKKKQMNDGEDNTERVQLEIAYSSMIDGTGREIIKSTDGPRKVDLDVWFANDKAIVCTVPSSLLSGKSSGNSGSNDDDDDVNPFGNGSNILYFVAENDLDGALNRLRAS